MLEYEVIAVRIVNVWHHVLNFVKRSHKPDFHPSCTPLSGLCVLTVHQTFSRLCFVHEIECTHEGCSSDVSATSLLDTHATNLTNAFPWRLCRHSKMLKEE